MHLWHRVSSDEFLFRRHVRLSRPQFDPHFAPLTIYEQSPMKFDWSVNYPVRVESPFQTHYPDWPLLHLK